MKMRTTALALSFALCAGLMTGCTSEADAPAKTDTPVKTEASAKTDAPADDAGDQSTAVPENIDPLGKMAEPVTVTSILNYSAAPSDCPPGVTPEDNSFNKTAKEELNIDVEWLWTAPDGQYDQKLGVALASGEIPDVMSVSKSVDYLNLLENEQIMPWDEALEYACDDLKEWIYRDPEVLKTVTNENGELMAIPQYWDPRRALNIMMIRKDWLDEVGMDVPETVEELEAVALAFREKIGANLGIGLQTKILARDAASMVSLMNMFGSYPNDWVEAADGTLQPGEISPNTKIALENLNRYYEEGILSKEFALYDYSKLREEALTEDLGILIAPFWAYDSMIGKEIAKNKDSKWVTAPVPTAEGTKGAILDEVSIEGYWVLNKDCKSPEAVMKLFNLWTLLDTAFPEASRPENGHVWNWAPTNFYDPNDINTLHERFNKQLKTGDYGTVPEGVTGSDVLLWDYAEDYYKWKDGEGTYPDGNEWGKYLARIDEDGAWGTIRKVVEDGKYELNKFYGSATETMISRRATMDKLTEETFVKMVMGEMPIEEFDEYVKNWMALGGEDVINEVNEWYKSK